VDALRKANPTQSGAVPVDLVTASGSGLDSHISPAGAAYQVDRVAQARHVDPQRIRELVLQHTAGRQLGVLGEPRVNLLALNLALDGLQK
jgi:K+-transporting ATPase ATPase C chain